MSSSSESGFAPEEDSLFDLALYVYRYARRWAVGQSPDPEDAVIYDACIDILNTEFAPRRLETRTTPTAAEDRYRRYGREVISNSFTIPISAEDAVVILHRFARRYTNGRGSFTAALVNATAEHLLARGHTLETTRRLDGTIWAADGAEGEHDGLDQDRRQEALDALPDQAPAPPAFPDQDS